ncbi:MAG: DNA repair protein RadA [Bacteroidales bacterium]|nr:DNA repair protein RadA [Bacteroidales bacterium]MCF8459036.1 DNA repair protein RadA [Bacteroidales bacterium]
MSPEQIEQMIADGRATNTSFWFVFRGTKNGTFRGEETFENIVDASIRMEEGKTEMMKNRFGGAGEMEIF